MDYDTWKLMSPEDEFENELPRCSGRSHCRSRVEKDGDICSLCEGLLDDDWDRFFDEN